MTVVFGTHRKWYKTFSFPYKRYKQTKCELDKIVAAAYRPPAGRRRLPFYSGQPASIYMCIIRRCQDLHVYHQKMTGSTCVSSEDAGICMFIIRRCVLTADMYVEVTDVANSIKCRLPRRTAEAVILQGNMIYQSINWLLIGWVET